MAVSLRRVDDAKQAPRPRTASGPRAMPRPIGGIYHAVRAQKVCLMCGAKIAGGSDAHTADCAIRRADSFVRTRIQHSASSGLN